MNEDVSSSSLNGLDGIGKLLNLSLILLHHNQFAEDALVTTKGAALICQIIIRQHLHNQKLNSSY